MYEDTGDDDSTTLADLAMGVSAWRKVISNGKVNGMEAEEAVV